MNTDEHTWDAVEGRVLIYIHKEQMLADIESRFMTIAYRLARLSAKRALLSYSSSFTASSLPKRGAANL